MPSAITEQLQAYPSAAQKLHDSIQIWWKEAIEKRDKSEAAQLGIDLLRYVPDMERLSLLSDGFKLTWQIIVTCEREVWAKIPRLNARILKKLFEAMDSVLYRVFRRSSGELSTEEAINWLKQVRQNTWINSAYFQRTHDLLWSIKKGPEAVQLFHQKLEASIRSKQLELTRMIRQPWFEQWTKTIKNPYFDEIRRLSSMSLEGSKLAFHLLLLVGRQSYDWERVSEDGDDRKLSDMEMDKLMVEIANTIKDEDPGFQPSAAFENLRCEIQYLKSRPIYDLYFHQSFFLLLTWFPEQEHDYLTKYCADYFARVKETSSLWTKRLNIYLLDGRQPVSDWMSRAISPFIDEISKLSQIPSSKSLDTCIRSIIFLGVHAFSRKTAMFYGNARVTSRSFDTEADNLLLKLLFAREKYADCEYANAICELEKVRQDLAKLGLTAWCQKSYEHMKMKLASANV